jgi:hypothetical protein
MTGELAFIIEKKDRALIAPAQALQDGNLYTIRDGRLNRVENAVVGLKSVERIELKQGLSVGDEIVVSSVQEIRDGSYVRTTMIDPAVAAGSNKSDSGAVKRNPLGQQ